MYNDKKYNEKIDIWSLGCLFGEIFNKTPLFKGTSDFDMFDLIYEVIGGPNVKINIFSFYLYSRKKIGLV